MLLLGVDTAGREGSLALVEFSAEGIPTTLEVQPIAGGTFSAQLVPQLSAMLQRRGRGKADLQGIAAVSGPGSFTGLRVGLAAVKGLAEILPIPIVTVSVLELLAFVSGEQGRVTTALDAQRREVFVGEYEVTASSTRTNREQLLPADEFLSIAPAGVVVCEDALQESLSDRGLKPLRVQRPTADSACLLGYLKLQRGETTTPEALDANYIRRSDAELFSLPKLP